MRFLQSLIASLCIIILSCSLYAKTPVNPPRDTTDISAYKPYIDNNLDKHLKEFIEFVSIPSLSSIASHKGDVRRCAEWLKAKIQSIGIPDAQVLETEGNPVVYANWNQAKGKPTVLIYGHYDVQPVQESMWTNPPFSPKEENGRIYGRGAADDKGGVAIAIWAIEALLQKDGKLPVNIKFLFEGEEEIGSTHLGNFVETHKDILRAEYAYNVDAFQKSDDQPEMVMSVRGGATMEFTLKTANRDLHSGVYGGKAPNAAQILAQLIATFHNSDGKVAVEGFYDKVLPITEEEKAMAAHSDYDEKKELSD